MVCFPGQGEAVAPMVRNEDFKDQYLRDHSSAAGSFQPSHKPAKTKGASSFIPIAYGIPRQAPSSTRKSRSAGIRQRRFLK